LIDTEFKKLLNDRFSTEELCLLLDIDIEDFVDRTEDLIEENINLIYEYLGLEDEEDTDRGELV